MATFSTLGKPTPLIEGRAKVTGTTRYAPDLNLPGMLHARLVTSLYPHARLTGIDKEEAEKVDGVVAVLTAADMPDIEPANRHRLLLARERVIFVGQPVALVLATSEAAAQDGADLVFVDYDPLPAATTIEAALRDDAPAVWPDGLPGGSDEAAAHGAAVGSEDGDQNRPANLAKQNHFTRGDVDAGLAEADVVIERQFTTPMVHQGYLETHSTVVQPDPLTGGATVWTSTQAPYYIQEETADILGVLESDVKVVATPVGGGFGGKFILYEPLVALAARAAGRPVRLVLRQSEELLAGNPAPAGRLVLRAGARKDGTLTALDAEISFDAGCYPDSPAGIAGLLLGSTYQVPNIDIRGNTVLTFKPSQGAYRAPGAPQAFFALESVMNDLAQALDIDPLALRLKNASRTGDPMVNDKSWQHIGLHKVLEAMQDHPIWQEREQARAQGRAVGVAVGGWPGGTEPAAASCQLERDGTLHIHLSTVDLNGTNTGFVLLASEAFGVPPEKIRVITHDTQTGPYAGATGGSKVTYTVGPAVIQAAQKAREQTLNMAAEQLEADPADLEIVDGEVRVRGVPDRGIELGELAAETMSFGGKFPPIAGHGSHAENRSSPGFCGQLVELEVDQDTGTVTVHRMALVQDVGRVINPLAIEGQMRGGAVQGLGWSLYEQILYDEQGQLVTGSWMDYGIPKFMHAAPTIDTVMVEVPSDYGPLGARGVGEPPVIATAGAVGNAIAAATGRRLTELPMTPQRVLKALQRG